MWDLRMPSVILQHVEALSNAHIVATADPGVSIAYTLDARSQVPHEPGLQRHVQVSSPPALSLYLYTPAIMLIITFSARCWT